MKKIRKISIAVLMCMMAFLMAMQAGAATEALNKKKLTLKVGESFQMKVKNAGAPVRWKSSDYVKAPVTTDGRVVARKKGSVTITAAVGEQEYTCKLKIKQPVTKITLNKTSHTLKKGKSVTLKASVLPTNANNKKITWKSSNTKIATVSSKGKIKAKKKGTVTITATAKDGSKVYASCKIKVTAKTAAVQQPQTEPETETEATPTAPGQPSAKALRYLEILQGYSDQVKADKAKGITWKYSSSYENHSTFAAEQKKAAKGNTAYCNCALLVRWGLRDLGVMTGKDVFWSVWNGKKAYFNYNSVIKKNWAGFAKNFEIITVDKTPAQLAAEGNLLPGDICGWNGVQHTNVYAGNQLWYEGGRLSNVVNGVYSGFGPVKSLGMKPSGGKTIHQILRLK